MADEKECNPIIMNVENITISQIWKALTAKHLWNILSAGGLILGVSASGGYWFGQHNADAKNTDLMHSNSKLMDQLEAERSRSEKAIRLASELDGELSRKEQEIKQLRGALKFADNCGFIHQRILALHKTIEDLRRDRDNRVIYGASNTTVIEDIVLHEKLLVNYQNKLDSCGT